MLSAEELNTLRELAGKRLTTTDMYGNFFCASCTHPHLMDRYCPEVCAMDRIERLGELEQMLTPLLDSIDELQADRDKWKERVRQLCLAPKN